MRSCSGEQGQEGGLGSYCGWKHLPQDRGWASGGEEVVRTGHLPVHFRAQSWGGRTLTQDDSRLFGLSKNEVVVYGGGEGCRKSRCVPGLYTSQLFKLHLLSAVLTLEGTVDSPERPVKTSNAGPQARASIHRMGGGAREFSFPISSLRC